MYCCKNLSYLKSKISYFFTFLHDLGALRGLPGSSPILESVENSGSKHFQKRKIRSFLVVAHISPDAFFRKRKKGKMPLYSDVKINIERVTFTLFVNDNRCIDALSTEDESKRR